MSRQLRRRSGFAEKSGLTNIDRREQIYRQFFGNRYIVNHEFLPLEPHIDVYVYERGYRGRDCFTLVTGGMSDISMQMPPGPSSPRAELVLYITNPETEYVEFLRWLAHIPNDQQTWFSHGTTMTNGQPPEPIFPPSTLNCILFLLSMLNPDRMLGDYLKIDGEPVNLLRIVPISEAECQLCLQGRLDDLLELFDAEQLPVILDPRRRSLK